MSGTIVYEDKEKITMDLGANMVLHIEKSKVRHVVRSPKQEDPRAVNKPKPTPTPVVNLKNPVEKSESHQTTEGGVTLNQTHRTVVRPVPPAETDFSNVSGDVRLEASWSGTAIQEGANFRWNALVIQSTVTSSLPSWLPAKPTEEQGKVWSETLTKIDDQLKGHVDIYNHAVQSFGPRLLSLRAATESDLKVESERTWKGMLSRTEKQQQGLTRRLRAKSKLATP